ncbi:carboxyltransferase domain-containing protein, partial [Burkholderia cepacia]|nr:carboxyltransferase domain-containing protein [Burkholderia cepacia]
MPSEPCQSDDATRIYPLGDAALVCEVPPPATLDCQRRVCAEESRAWPDVVDVVPGMNNLTIVFDALATTAESLT